MKTEIIEKKSDNITRKTDILRNIIMAVLLYFIVTVSLFLLYDIHAYAADYTINDLSLDWSRVTLNKDSTSGTMSFEYPVLTSNGVDGYTNHYIYVPLNENKVLNASDRITLTQNNNSKAAVALSVKEGNIISYKTIFSAGNSGTYTFNANTEIVGVRFSIYWTNNNLHTFNLETNFGETFETEVKPKTSRFTIPYDYGVKIDISNHSDLTIFNNNQDATIFGNRPLFSSTFNTGIFYKQTSTELSSFIIFNNLSGSQLDLHTEKRNLIGKATSASFYKEFNSSDGNYVYIFYPAVIGALSQSMDNLNTGSLTVYLNHPCNVTLIKNNDYLYASDNPENNVNNNIGTDDKPVYYEPENNKWIDTGATDENGNYVEYDTTYRPSASIIDTNDNLNSFYNNLLTQLKSFFDKPIEAVNNLVSTGSTFFHELSGLWSWLPSSVVTLITSCLTITLTIGLIKVFL